MKTLKLVPMTALALAGWLASAEAAIITVNTGDNTDFGPGKTNLWLAITTANTNGETTNTINFNIPGDGPHYLITPPWDGSLAGGYPLITNHNLTIDGYSQPGAMPNTNTILGSNTAILKIVIDSREFRYGGGGVGASTMNYALITGKTYGNPYDGVPYYGPNDAAQIGIYDARNITIKGLCFLNDRIASGPTVYSVALGADYPTNLLVDLVDAGDGSERTHFYPDYNLHVAGCWFNLMPDGKTVVDGGHTGVRVMRHRSYYPSGPNGYYWGRWSPSDITIGVAKDSPNPRAEFNIFISQAVQVALHGERNRYCGNFFNVLADGMTDYFPDPQTSNPNLRATTAFIGETYAGYGVVGTDGDGVNDAEERNVMAGLPRRRANGVAQINYQSGCYHLKIAGNYVGVAVDGVTRWTNCTSFLRISTRPDTPTNIVVGTEFDGVSDDLEANVIANHWPLDYWFPSRDSQPVLGQAPYSAYNQLSPRYQADAPTETMDTDKLGFSDDAGGPPGPFAVSFRGNKMMDQLTGPISPFASWRDNSNVPGYFPHFTNMVAGIPSSTPAYADEGKTNFITVVDPVSSTRRLKGTFPLGKDPYTNVVVDVYVANEDGLVHGAQFQTLTNILPVWVQSESVLAYNLLADTPTDLNPATGEFTFDIASYNIPAGTKVTVTAAYAKQGEIGTYMAEAHSTRFSLPVTLNAAAPITIASIVNHGDGTGTITWTGGDAPYVVEQRTNLTLGSWTPVAVVDTPSLTQPIAPGEAFYRIR